MISQEEFDSLSRAREDAQRIIDEQHLQCLDRISVYEARGAVSLTQAELFDWFLTTRLLGAMDGARRNGWGEVDYIPLEVMPAARRHIGGVETFVVLKDLEPSRRQRKVLGGQAVRGAVDLLRLGRQLTLGDPSITMREYELDSESYPSADGDTQRANLTDFVWEWDEFLAEEGRTPTEI